MFALPYVHWVIAVYTIFLQVFLAVISGIVIAVLVPVSQAKHPPGLPQIVLFPAIRPIVVVVSLSSYLSSLAWTPTGFRFVKVNSAGVSKGSTLP